MRTLTIWVCGTLLSASACAWVASSPAGEATIEDQAAASAILDESLASLHLMYAAIERKDMDGFRKFRNNTSTQLAKALAHFQEYKEKVPDRNIEVSDQDKGMVYEFKSALAGYSIPEPKTQKELVGATIELMRKLKMQVDKSDIGPGSDPQPLHDLTGTGLTVAKGELATMVSVSTKGQ
jgi:hypothetical protein